jgi:uncharacterized coiled-coil protein SlyX
MKLLPLFLLVACCQTGYAQHKDNNNTQQIEQLQIVKETISRRIDSLNAQLQEHYVTIENLQKKLQQLKKDRKTEQKKTINEANNKIVQLSQEMANTEMQLNNLRKNFDMRLTSLDKAVGMVSNLEEKIKALNKEKNK